MLAASITAGAGFLLAVLWFDLMFDVQVWRYRRSPVLPSPVLDSIAAYYRRVTTDASPMGRLVAVVMIALLGALVAQAATGSVAWWTSAVSISAAASSIGLATARVFPRARRLGSHSGPDEARSELARSIFREHLACLMAIALLLAVQLSAV